MKKQLKNIFEMSYLALTIVSTINRLYYRGVNIAESFLPKNAGDIGTFGDIAPPLLYWEPIAGSFLPNCVGFRQKISAILPPVLHVFIRQNCTILYSGWAVKEPLKGVLDAISTFFIRRSQINEKKGNFYITINREKSFIDNWVDFIFFRWMTSRNVY